LTLFDIVGVVGVVGLKDDFCNFSYNLMVNFSTSFDTSLVRLISLVDVVVIVQFTRCIFDFVLFLDC